MGIPYPSFILMRTLRTTFLSILFFTTIFTSILQAEEVVSSSTASTPSSLLSSGIYRFSLTRRHITVPVNSTQHHRYGNFERRMSSNSIPDNSPVLSSNDRQTQDEVPIYGDFRRLAYFYADIFIGSGPQKFTVITDTGSSLTAVPCIDCGNCGTHMNPRFNPGQSSTAQLLTCSSGCPGSSHCSANKCTYVQSYAEGSSIRGTLYQDIVYTGGDISGGIPAEYAIPFKFGCGTSEGGLFVSQEADGIMGLGQSDMSIIRALWDSRKLNNNMFSLCLAMTGGTFTLGEMDTRLHTSPIAWAKMNLAGFYIVPVGGFSLDQYPLRYERMNSPHTILDSGTTFTYLPSETYADLRSALTQYCSGDRVNRCKGNPVSVPNEAVCYRLDDPSDIHSFPTVHITLQGVDGTPVVIDVLPQYLFINMGWDGGAYCLSMYDNGDRGGVIGANVMMGHDVVFDMAGTGAGPRAGFAPSTCQIPSPGNPTSSSTVTATPSPSGTGTPVTPSILPSPSTVPPLPSPSLAPGTSTSSIPLPVSPSPSSSSDVIDNTQHTKDPVGQSDGSTTIVIAVMSTLIVGCILIYCCLSCECRIGRMVIRLENNKSETRVLRYARINEMTRSAGNQRSTNNGTLPNGNDDEDDLFDDEDEVVLSSPKSSGNTATNTNNSNRRVQAVRENAGTGTTVVAKTTTPTPKSNSTTIGTVSTAKRMQGESEEQTAALDKMAAALSMGNGTSSSPSTTNSINSSSSVSTNASITKKPKDKGSSPSVVINIPSNDTK